MEKQNFHKDGRGGPRENSGRPRKDQKGTSVTVSFCLTPTENELFRNKVEESGLSVSSYIRNLIFG